MGADFIPLVIGEAAVGDGFQGVDVHLDLVGEKRVDGGPQFQQSVDGLLALLGSELAGDFFDEHTVGLGVLRLVDSVELEDVAEQGVEIPVVLNVLLVVKLGEPLDHAGQQQGRQA